ncbi:transposase family protein [Streptomyces goshikiensis]|uniref:transposase family protein n=1 Tax=Streptomyces goshikiensis TaxID=1942 RepID=UPI00365D10D1
MVDAACCGPPGPCPLCQHPAARVHIRYWRHIAGLPASGRQMVVRLRVRRFFCDQSQCRRQTYVEQVAGLTEPRRRTSMAARSAMRSVAVELGGRPGQRNSQGQVWNVEWDGSWLLNDTAQDAAPSESWVASALGCP